MVVDMYPVLIIGEALTASPKRNCTRIRALKV